MKKLHTITEKLLLKHLCHEKLLPRLIYSKLEEHGLILTKRQIKVIEKYFRAIASNETLHLEISDRQIKSMKSSDYDEIKCILDSTIDLAISEYEQKTSKFIEIASKKIIDISIQAGVDLFSELSENLEELNSQILDESNSFRDALMSQWFEPLGLLRCYISVSDELLIEFDKFKPDNAPSTITKNLLNRIHAKANQIAKEILVLIENGFADGAMARWRSLHELSVICAFIQKHGDNCALKYIDHEHVIKYKKTIEDNVIREKLNLQKIAPDYIDALKCKYDELILKYGEYFKSDYGWASEELSEKRPTFKLLEEKTEFDFLRYEYGIASANIHLNHAALRNPISVPYWDNKNLYGPSNFGLETPAILCAKSLFFTVSSILKDARTMDFVVMNKMMSEFLDLIDEQFNLHGNAMMKSAEILRARKIQRKQKKLQK